MNCREDLRTQSWLDGELQGAAAQVAECHMELCAECQAQAANTVHLSDTLRRATRHYAPDALRARINGVIDREIRRRQPRAFWVGAASGTGMTALAAALVIFVLLPPTAATLTASVIDAHDRALTSNQIIVVASSSHHTVKPWLAAHVGISPPVTDFTAEGFALAGGRTDEVAGSRAAVTVYRHGNHEIDLFAWRSRDADLPGPGVTRGFRSAFWKSRDLDFAAVSDVDLAAFEKFIALARAQEE